MRGKLSIDNNLIDEAHRVGGHKTREETLTEALSEYIAKPRRLEILALLGTIDFDPAYDYKADRNRKR